MTDFLHLGYSPPEIYPDLEKTLVSMGTQTEDDLYLEYSSSSPSSVSLQESPPKFSPLLNRLVLTCGPTVEDFKQADGQIETGIHVDREDSSPVKRGAVGKTDSPK